MPFDILLGGFTVLSKLEIEGVFRVTGAIITGGHFVYAKKPDGWYHGPDYVNKDAIYPFVREFRALSRIIAMHFAYKGIETVVGPTIGGALLSQRVTDFLPCQVPVFSVFVDEVDQKRVIKRGYDTYVSNRKCLVVEDIVNSGLTVAKTCQAISLVGGHIVGVGTLCNRSGGKVTAKTLGVPELFSLLDLDMKMYKEEECPLCKSGVPVRTDIGKGMEFLNRTSK